MLEVRPLLTKSAAGVLPHPLACLSPAGEDQGPLRILRRRPHRPPRRVRVLRPWSQLHLVSSVYVYKRVLLLTGVVVVSCALPLPSNLVGLLYPMYASVKAIESKDSADDTQWLVYWIVYGVFGFLETFIDLILYWIPFFYAIKIAFLVWCMHPTTKGATVLYTSFIRSAFLAHEEKIDSLLNGAAKASDAAAEEPKKDK